MVNTAKTPAPRPPAARRRLSAAEREQQIIAGAVDFFARHGLEAQTRELAAQIGVTHALLYHYFPSKQALIERVYETVIANRWNPAWETLLDNPRLAPEDKLCRFYREYLPAILTPEWLRVFMYSGMSDGLIPQRYFGLLREKLFPRLLREARRAHGHRGRGKPTLREQALLMGLHGGLIYQLGIMPLCYGQHAPGEGDAALIDTFIRDRVQAYLAQAGRLSTKRRWRAPPERTLMGLSLNHYSIRSANLDACRTFYEGVLGLAVGPRPDFPFPGLWLYAGDTEQYANAVVHIIGVDRNDASGLKGYLGERDEKSLHGSGVVDHVAFFATGLAEMRAKLDRLGVASRERTVPGLGLHQVFIDDPNGVVIELNYPAAEAAA